VSLLLLVAIAPANAQRAAPPTVTVAGAGGDTFVLLTGVIGGVAGFRQIERRLVEQGNRVIIIDPYRLSLDSSDVSFAALARRVDAELGIRGVVGATIVGHAHGGGVAIRLAADSRGRARELFLLNVGALADNRNPVFSSSIRLAPIITRIPKGRSFVRRRILDGIRENSGQSEWLDDSAARAYSDPMLDNIGKVVAMALRLGEAREPEPLTAVIARIRVPVTLILGALRCPASPGAEELAAFDPLGKLVRIHKLAGVCHFPHEEAPDELLTHLVRRRTPPDPVKSDR